jgi:hypothetical protein
MNRAEREMLEMLSNQIHFLALSQVAREWFGNSPSALRQAARMAQHLSNGAWIAVNQVLARPISDLWTPLCCWQHGQPEPDFRRVIRILHRRAKVSARVTPIVAATTRARALFGDGREPRRIKLTQTTHDLHVAEVFLRYGEQGFDVQSSWLSEDRLPLAWPLRQRPDALLLDDEGHFLRAIEYGGDYPIERLQELHFALASLPLAYEIW